MPATTGGRKLSARSYRHFVAPRALAWLGLLFPVYAGAEESYLAIRNHNPFLQIFGLPAFETAAASGAVTVRDIGASWIGSSHPTSEVKRSLT